jgi:hypothetical protein
LKTEFPIPKQTIYKKIQSNNLSFPISQLNDVKKYLDIVIKFEAISVLDMLILNGLYEYE